MLNPFTVGIAEENAFCNREKEKADLLTYAKNCQSVVLYAKRRYGKSSLVKAVLKEALKENILVVYADLFSVSSEHDFLIAFAKAITHGINKECIDTRPFKDKIVSLFSRLKLGFDIAQNSVDISVSLDKNTQFDVLLEDILSGVHNYIDKNNLRACIVLDEFQEITELPNPKKIEGILRSFMQSHRNVGYFYVGSRRRLLLDMFTSKNRPFYKSAFAYTLDEIKKDSFVPYITDKFRITGKSCSQETAEMIYDHACGYPYYVQKLASLAWNLTEENCTTDTVKKAYSVLLTIEEPSDFEGIWSGLPMGQKVVLKAIALEPTFAPFSREYLGTYEISQSSMQKALEVLLKKDIIEKTKDGEYRITDPIMGEWLKNTTKASL